MIVTGVFFMIYCKQIFIQRGYYGLTTRQMENPWL